MATKLDRRVALAFTLVSTVTIIGLANSASANPPQFLANSAAVVQRLTARLPTVQGFGQTPIPSISVIRSVGSNVGSTSHINAPASLPSPGGQPTVLATVSPGLSPGVVRGGGSTGAVSPGTASTGGSQDFIVTATVAQSSDVSAGTFTFDTGADGTGAIASAAPLAPPTAKEAGLDGVVAPNASGKSSIIATVAGTVTAPDGSRRVAVDLYGDGLLSFAVDSKTGGRIASASGNTLASSGKTTVVALGEPVTMLASVARDIVRSTINLTGIRQANGFLMRDGRLVLVFVDKDR